jgi:hypothetical protein
MYTKNCGNTDEDLKFRQKRESKVNPLNQNKNPIQKQPVQKKHYSYLPCMKKNGTHK